MRVLVTGAAGFIGSSVSASLTLAGHEVLGVDSYSDYYSVELKKFRVKEFLQNSGITFQEIDISNFDGLNQSVKEFRPDAVINLAAQAGVRLPLGDFNKYIQSNVIGFTNIARASLENGVENFLYASSSSVYGDKAAIPYQESESNLHPNSFYGSTKLANELLTPTLVKNSATVARGLRFFTVYGPWGRPDMAYFRMIANVIAGTDFNFFGDGSIERDFTFISDAVSSVINLTMELDSRKPGFSDVVNLGGGRPLSMNYLLETVGSLTGKKVEFERFETNKNDATKTMSDSNYIQELIGSKPSIKLEDGISKTIEWASSDEISKNLDKWVKSVK